MISINYPALRRAITLSALLLGHCAASVAQESAAQTTTDSRENRTINRSQLVQIVLERNFAILAQKLEHEVAQWDISREWSVFEPIFLISAERSELERRNSTEQAAAQRSLNDIISGVPPTQATPGGFVSDSNNFVSGIQGQLPMGTQYTIQSTLQDVNTSLADLGKDEYITFAGIEFVQPLLRNSGTAVTMTRIRLASVQSEIVFQRLRQTVIQIVAASEGFYWDLVAAQQELEMRTESAARATKILADNRERVRVGKMSELEVQEAETELATRRRDQIEARQLMITATAELRALIAEEPTAPEIAIVDDGFFGIRFPEQVGYFESANLAFAMNPEYLVKLQELEQDNIRLVFAKNQRWPQLDVKATYGLNGLALSPEESIRMITSSQFEAWTVGMEFRMALGGGKQSASEFAIAGIRKRQSLEEIKQLEFQITNQLDDIIKRLELDRERVRTFADEVKFNQRRLEVELTRLYEGKSTSREVFRLEEQLSNAQKQQISGLVQVRKTLLSLEVATGQLLEIRNIELLREELKL